MQNITDLTMYADRIQALYATVKLEIEPEWRQRNRGTLRVRWTVLTEKQAYHGTSLEHAMQAAELDAGIVYGVLPVVVTP